MKSIQKVSLTLLPLLILWFPTHVNAETHKATASPSGRYKLRSEPCYQIHPDGSKGDIGATISLIAQDGMPLSKCYGTFPSYIDVSPEIRGTDDWQTKAYWNKEETMVAVYSGGRTWSRIDFYSVVKDQIAILPHPNWQFCLFKDLKEYSGNNTRLYELFGKWTGTDTFEMTVVGTAVLNDGQSDRYPQFNYKVKGKMFTNGIQITKIKIEGESGSHD